MILELLGTREGAIEECAIGDFDRRFISVFQQPGTARHRNSNESATSCEEPTPIHNSIDYVNHLLK